MERVVCEFASHPQIVVFPWKHNLFVCQLAGIFYNVFPLLYLCVSDRRSLYRVRAPAKSGSVSPPSLSRTSSFPVQHVTHLVCVAVGFPCGRSRAEGLQQCRIVVFCFLTLSNLMKTTATKSIQERIDFHKLVEAVSWNRLDHASLCKSPPDQTRLVWQSV